MGGSSSDGIVTRCCAKEVTFELRSDEVKSKSRKCLGEGLEQDEPAWFLVEDRLHGCAIY